MKTETKTLDCVELMHEGAKRVQDETRDMTLDEKLAYWEEAYQKMSSEPNTLRPNRS